MCIFGDVLNRIDRRDSNSGPSGDVIRLIFVKSYRFMLSTILGLIFNKSLSTGVFHSLWKTCIVRPTFKGEILPVVDPLVPI